MFEDHADGVVGQGFAVGGGDEGFEGAEVVAEVEAVGETEVEEGVGVSGHVFFSFVDFVAWWMDGG